MAGFRSGSFAGVAGVALNVLAVAALSPVPHTYSPADVAAWLAETRAAPEHAIISAWAFTFGLVALAAFAAMVAKASRSSAALVGAVLFGSGALLDAAGTLAPIAALHVDAPIGIALLWLSLLLDSAFNGLLGVGLLFFSISQTTDDGWPRGLRWLAAVAGAASVPVTLQFHSNDFARLLAIAGPLWLTWVMWTSVVLWKREAPHAP